MATDCRHGAESSGAGEIESSTEAQPCEIGSGRILGKHPHSDMGPSPGIRSADQRQLERVFFLMCLCFFFVFFFFLLGGGGRRRGAPGDPSVFRSELCLGQIAERCWGAAQIVRCGASRRIRQRPSQSQALALRLRGTIAQRLQTRAQSSVRRSALALHEEREGLEG